MDDLAVAGGVESMSRVPIFSDGGPMFADPEVAAAGGFVHMGVAADIVATLGQISREDCDAYALESHRRAAAARDEGASTLADPRERAATATRRSATADDRRSSPRSSPLSPGMTTDVAQRSFRTWARSTTCTRSRARPR